jgi:hypothetical protein
MSLVLEPLSVELAAAAERQARRAIRRRRGGRWAAAGAVVVLGSVGAAAATGTFFWRPQLGNDTQGHPTVSRSGVPADQLKVLGVLRRAQTDADRGAAARYAAHWLGSDFHGVRTDSIRVLSNGTILFSAKDGPTGYNSLCFFQADKEAGAETCFSLDELQRGDAALFSVPPPGIGGSANVIGVVPDGVAAVRFGTTTAAVHQNAYEARLHPGDERAGTTLLDRDGHPWGDR